MEPQIKFDSPTILLQCEPFLLNHIHNTIHILPANLFAFGFHHNSYYRFGTGFADQDSSGVAKGVCYLLYSCLDVGIVLAEIMMPQSNSSVLAIYATEGVVVT